VFWLCILFDHQSDHHKRSIFRPQFMAVRCIASLVNQEEIKPCRWRVNLDRAVSELIDEMTGCPVEARIPQGIADQGEVIRGNLMSELARTGIVRTHAAHCDQLPEE
jgi:hypothetical protein